MLKLPQYTPRWISGIFDFVEQLPFPGWSLVLGVIAISAVANHLQAWHLGVLPVGQLHSFLALQGAYLVTVPAVWRLLDRHAQRAMHDYGRALGKSEKETKRILTEFLSMPPIPAMLLVIAGIINGYLSFISPDNVYFSLTQRILPWTSMLGWVISYVFFFLIGYRVLLQIPRINRLYSAMEADPFSPGPVYILTRYGSAFAATLLIVSHGLVLLTQPQYYFSTSGLFYMIFLTIIGLLIFFAPVGQINRRMRRAKDQLLSENGRAQKAINQRLQLSATSGSLTGLDKLRTAVNALREQREVLMKLPTWPWQADTLRNLVAPMLIPVLVYLAQRIVAGLFGL